MLAVFACVAGGIWQFSKGQNKRKAVLLLVMAAVLLANVLILTL